MLPWKTALVVGASSGMGAEVARRLTKGGCKTALVARRADALTKLAEEFNTATPVMALVFAHDVANLAEVPELFQRICRDLGGLDLIVYAAGVMPRITDETYDTSLDAVTISANLTGAVAWLNPAAERFGRAGAGTIVGIGSVAGDRGRRGNPVYCAVKAGLATYLEALRNRVGRLGVAVVTIKPGPVDTPMTQGLTKLPMLISVEQAAEGILRAAAARKSVVYLPGKWRLVMWVVRSIPSFIFKKLNF